MAIALFQDQLLAALFNQDRWDIKLNMPHWVLLAVPRWADCCYVVNHYRSSLARCVASGMPLYFEYGEGTRHVCQITSTGEIMDISIGGEITINRALLDVFGEMLSHSDRSLGLVRLSDERQVTVSGGGGGAFLGTVSREDAQRLHRSDYWHPEDLYEFNRAWQREVSINGDWFEYSYRSFILGRDRGVDSANRYDQRFTTRYKLVAGPRGEHFHFCENLAMEAIG
jgi:hypothetical protein